MLPIGTMMFGMPRDGADLQRMEIRKQRLFQQCTSENIEEKRIIGKSSETITKELEMKNVRPDSYGVEYHLEGTIKDYL